MECESYMSAQYHFAVPRQEGTIGYFRSSYQKLSSFVSDLLGASARRMLKALADGETNPAALAALADRNLRATPEQLCDALGACTDLKPVCRRLLKMALEQLQFLGQQIGQLDKEMASLLSQHQDAVERLAEVPGLGVDSAQQIIAEVGPTAATFPSEKCLSSWVGACPGDDESAGINYSHRSPKGNRHMRRLLNQAASAAARTKGSIFEIVYRRSVSRLGHNQAIGAIAHRQCRLIWLILHQGVRYEERMRTDFLQKLSTQLIHKNQVIMVETLGTKNLLKNRRLARAISDAGTGEFVGMLEYKCKWPGRTLVKVARFFPPSKLCCICHQKNVDLKLQDRWTCSSCHTEHQRDENAVVNIFVQGLRILAEGRSVLACGGTVGPKREFRRGPVKQET